MYPVTEPSRQGSERIRIGNIQNFAPMGAPPKTFVHGKDVITERKKYLSLREIIVDAGQAQRSQRFG